MSLQIIHGDCRSVMAAMPADSVDAIVTDPPYGLSDEPDVDEVLRHWLAGDDYVHSSRGFMQAEWDSFVPGPSVWREALRVLKPGGFCLSFFGGRTYDLGVIAMRLAGFEVRDMMAWLHGQGMPKGDGALKPALEPIALARKPLSERTVGLNIARWGVGALNIEACRVPTGGEDRSARYNGKPPGGGGTFAGHSTEGRWPPSVLHDGSLAVLDLFPERRVNPPSRKVSTYKGDNAVYGANSGTRFIQAYDADGSAARFYPSFPPDDAPARYCPKAASKARVSRCTSCGHRLMGKAPDACPSCGATGDGTWAAHPTVKPVALMQWLCRLVTPPGGEVLDPFTGTGTTLAAARAEGFGAVGIEMDAAFVGDIHHRLGMPMLQAAE